MAPLAKGKVERKYIFFPYDGTIHVFGSKEWSKQKWRTFSLIPVPKEKHRNSNFHLDLFSNPYGQRTETKILNGVITF
jgi:hypothetical protein